MRVYSPRERVLFGIGLLVALAGCVGVALVMITQPGAAKDPWLWVAGVGLLGGVYICVKIIITGRATRYLEQDVRDAFGFHRGGGPDDRAV